MPSLKSTLFTSSLIAIARSATYSLSNTIIGSDFYSQFTFQAISDPTNGRVNYVDQATAQADNLTFASSDAFVLRADDTTVLSASGAGRNSVRIQSNAQYSTHVAVFDMAHMPTGCGTWPAVWELGDDWPNGGEVDIVEGVNDVVPNQSTLHTGAGCTMTGQSQTGTIVSTDCVAADNGNAGCGVDNNKANNYGASFNSAGGGWYAMERTDSFINVYFWSRGDSNVPSDLKNGASSINTSNWGTPIANFPDNSCDLDAFSGANIIINLTFCGDWAGQSSIYAASGCPSTCVDYVNNNPSAFTDAYFQFNSIRVYE